MNYCGNKKSKLGIYCGNNNSKIVFIVGTIIREIAKNLFIVGTIIRENRLKMAKNRGKCNLFRNKYVFLI